MTKWRKRGVFFLAGALLLLILMAVFIYTSLGLRTVSYVLKKAVPELKIDHIDGTLYDFKMSGFDLSMDGVQVKIGTTQFSLSGLCLLRGALCVNNLEAHNIEININTDALASNETEPSKNEAPFKLKTPVPIELERAVLGNVEVSVNDMRFGLNTFQGSATWIHDGILLAPTQANGLHAIFSDLSTKPIKKHTPAESLPTRLSNFLSEPLIQHLPNVHIPLKIGITELTGSHWLLHLNGDHHFDNVKIRGAVHNSEIKITQLITDIQSPYENAHVDLRGNITLAKRWPINAALNAETTEADSEATQISLKSHGNILGTLHTIAEVRGKNNVDLDATVNLNKKYLPIQAELKGTHFQWPLEGAGNYQLNNFDFSMKGMIRKLAVSGQGHFQGENLPKTQIKMAGESFESGFALNPLELNFANGGTASVQGNIDWRDGIEWQAKAMFNQIKLDPAFLNDPIDLQGYMELSGNLKGNQWQNQINDINLSGHLRQMPFNAVGKLDIQSDLKARAEHFKVNWGESHIVLNGKMTAQEPLNAQFELPDLSIFSNLITGKAEGSLVVSGSFFTPNLTTDIILKNFAYNQLIAEQLEIKGNTHYSDQLEGKIQITGSSLLYQDALSVETIALDLQGNERTHKLHIDIKGTPVASQLNLIGHLSDDREVWQGQLSDSNVSVAKHEWFLNHPTQLSYNHAQSKLFVQAHCWQNPTSNLCLTKDMSLNDQGDVNWELKNLDLAVFDLFLGSETQLLGMVSGKGQIHWSERGAFPTVIASLYSNKAYIHQQIGAKQLVIPFDIFKLNLQMNEQLSTLGWQVSLKEYGDITGNAKIIDPKGEKTLQGDIALKKLSLSIFTPMLQGGDYAKGLINANLHLGGNLEKPQINGRLSVNQTEIQSSQLPADVQAVSLTLDFLGQASKLVGEIRTKEGSIHLNGNANWESLDKWEARLSAKGEGITLSHAPIQTMTIIPDITISSTQNELTLGGFVNIPKARIKVESLAANVVNVSSDEVMLNNNLQPIKTKRLPFNINSNLFIVIGDDVVIDALGLNANIKGRLLVKQNKQGLGLNGQILIPQGRFHAYGQDLVVKKGELVFSGPVDTPLLNIEAIRNPDSVENNVIAGIRVIGPADNPDVKLFSEPQMSEQETLSYVLRGQGLENSDQNENDMMTAILIGLGTSQGGQYIGNVGELFGIKDLSLDTQGVGDNSQVVVSGYILPNLQIKYGVGIFDSLATFTLRYRLMPKLYLDVVSGLAQSVDLLYQFEI